MRKHKLMETSTINNHFGFLSFFRSPEEVKKLTFLRFCLTFSSDNEFKTRGPYLYQISPFETSTKQRKCFATPLIINITLLIDFSNLVPTSFWRWEKCIWCLLFILNCDVKLELTLNHENVKLCSVEGTFADIKLLWNLIKGKHEYKAKQRNLYSK